MELDGPHMAKVHEVLVGGTWMPITVGPYWQHYKPTEVGSYPGKAGWRECGTGAEIYVEMTAIQGCKFNTLRGKLEGG